MNKQLAKVRHARYYKERIEAGVCGSGCGAQAEAGKHRCRPCADKINAWNSEQNRRDKAAAFAAYGGAICVGCGETDDCCLSIDHIAQDGAAHRREKGMAGGSTFYRWLRQRKYPEGFRVLCMNCQQRAFRGFPFPLQSKLTDQ